MTLRYTRDQKGASESPDARERLCRPFCARKTASPSFQARPHTRAPVECCPKLTENDPKSDRKEET